MLTTNEKQRREKPSSQIYKVKPMSLFPYVGSKWKMMPRLIPLFPNHELFVDVFGGSGACILNKPRSRLETFNDLDSHIHSLLMLLMDSELRAKLVDRVRHTPARCRQVYLEALRLLKHPDGDPVSAAWAFLVASCQATCQCHPMLLRPCNWGYLVHKFRKGRMLRLPDSIAFFVSRFRYVQITNWNWSEVIRRFDAPTTFFFCDPSYWPVTDKQKYYANQMTRQDHEDMLATLQKIKGTAMLCGYDNPLYEECLSGWRKAKFATSSSMNVGGKRPKRIEVVWMNYNSDGTKLKRSSK